MAERQAVIRMSALTIHDVNTAIDYLASITDAPAYVRELNPRLELVRRPLEDIFRLAHASQVPSDGVMPSIAQKLKPLLNDLQSSMIKMADMFEPWLYPESSGSGGRRAWKPLFSTSRAMEVNKVRTAFIVLKRQMSAVAVEARRAVQIDDSPSRLRGTENESSDQPPPYAQDVTRSENTD